MTKHDRKDEWHWHEFWPLGNGSSWGATDKDPPKRPLGFVPATRIEIPRVYRPRGKRPA